MKSKQALTLLLILGSFTAFSACGRSSAEIYRAYNLTSVTGTKGQAVQDLAVQNRLSLQTGGDSTYFYSVPEQKDFINPDEQKLLDAEKSAQEAKEATSEETDENTEESAEETTDETEDLDETALPDDAPADEIEGKIDALQSDIKDALN